MLQREGGGYSLRAPIKAAARVGTACCTATSTRWYLEANTGTIGSTFSESITSTSDDAASELGVPQWAVQDATASPLGAAKVVGLVWAASGSGSHVHWQDAATANATGSPRRGALRQNVRMSLRAAGCGVQHRVRVGTLAAGATCPLAPRAVTNHASSSSTSRAVCMHWYWPDLKLHGQTWSCTAPG